MRVGIVIIFLFAGIINTNSQSLHDNDFNSQTLTDSLFNKLNTLRDSLNLQPLEKATPLQKAALNQATHIAETNKLIPFQMNNKLKTPAKRVAYFEGNFKNVGEINAAYQIRKNSENSYEAIADSVIASWKNKSSHFKNIKDRFFSKAGIGCKWNQEHKKIFVVATFGNPGYQLEAEVPDNVYGIKDPEQAKYRACGRFLQKFNKKPPDVKFDIVTIEDNIYFHFSDLSWFKQLFKDKKDGIAIDIITRKQFPCDAPNITADHSLYRGQLLEPVYRKELLENNKLKDRNELLSFAGKLPERFQDNTYEFNVLLLKDKHQCRYNTFYHLVHHKWELLKMGLFRDSTKPAGPLEEAARTGETYRFVIPFEKNKYHYDPGDIKPLYDSLQFNNYSIKHIKIRAYASVEGPTAHNRMLQQKRAESIVKALQTFQIDTIDKTISTAENWVEFMEDIRNTRYEYLKSLPQHKIKHKLNKEGLSEDLEFILKKHRKAVVFVKLDKKHNIAAQNLQKIRKIFDKNLRKDKLDQALKIQKAIFSGIEKHKLPRHYIDSLEIPEKTKNSTLLNNQIAFKYEQGIDSLEEAIHNYKKLNRILPGNNPRIRYNRCVLRLKLWKKDKSAINRKALFQDLFALKREESINPQLTQRLIINFYIIASEYLLQEKRYGEKNRAMNYIYKHYRELELTQKDILHIAKYFAAFSKYKWAIKLLEPYAKEIDVNEDLVFYYLNLTILKDKYNTQPEYRKILLNAFNINNSRFCHLYDPIGKGITFQLLTKKYLKEIYCENCYGYQY